MWGFSILYTLDYIGLFELFPILHGNGLCHFSILELSSLSMKIQCDKPMLCSTPKNSFVVHNTELSKN